MRNRCRRRAVRSIGRATAAEASRIVIEIAQRHQVQEVIKVKSITTEEIKLNEALEAAGIRPFETDLAELIIQLGDDVSSHILVPAIHRNRAEIRELFMRKLGWPSCPTARPT